MKSVKALFIVLGLIAMSCSKDDDTKPDQSLEQAAKNFSQNTEQITAPQGLKNSDDPYASMANSWIMMANGLSAYSAMFVVPDGATKTDGPIIASNGRVAKTNTEYLSYKWEDQQYGGIAYQIHAEADKYVYELFYRTSDTSDWIKLVYAEANKDHTGGMLKYFDADGAVVWEYDWQKTGNLFTITAKSDLNQTNLILELNTDTGAGNVASFDGDVKTYAMTWDAQGNGTWTLYDESGDMSDEGSWTAG